MKAHLQILLGLYIASLSLLRILKFDYLPDEIQLPEFVFLTLIALLFFRHFRSFVYDLLKGRLIDLILIGLLFLYLISGNFGFHPYTIKETIGIAYLILAFWTIRWILLFQVEHIPTFMSQSFNYCGLIAAIPAILGWLLASCGLESAWVRTSEIYYPYLGFIPRGQGFTQTPGMLVSILGICLIINVFTIENRSRSRKTYWLKTTIIILGVATTLAKSTLLIVATILFYLAMTAPFRIDSIFKRRTSLWGSYLSISILCLVHFLGTHFLFVSKKTDLRSLEAYLSQPAILGFESVDIYPSIYWELKKYSLSLGIQEGWTGIGAGRFVEFLGASKSAGHFPQNLPIADPHCTYFGLIAELGWSGFILLLFTLSIAVIWLKKLTSMDKFGVCLASIMVLMFLEGMAVDSLFFRHYWVVLAFIVSYLEKSTPSNL